MSDREPLSGLIDFHAHILPGLDDGPRDMAETETLLRQAYGEGIRVIFATSHYRPQLWQHPPERYWEQLEAVQTLAKQIGLDMQILPGSEVFYSGELIRALADGLCRPLRNRFVLLEFAPDLPFPQMLRAMDVLTANRYRPLVAHAERYACIQARPGLVRQLKTAGGWVQVNTGSIAGPPAPLVEHVTARRLLRGGLIDILGTDCHHAVQRPASYQACADYLLRRCSEEYAWRLLVENPGVIFREP
ncbi:MAG: hypothetical protein LIO95_11275 [Clostridiales bacterium]|nr:hypothetical protein [Clostridiales bacterium]